MIIIHKRLERLLILNDLKNREREREKKKKKKKKIYILSHNTSSQHRLLTSQAKYGNDHFRKIFCSIATIIIEYNYYEEYNKCKLILQNEIVHIRHVNCTCKL